MKSPEDLPRRRLNEPDVMPACAQVNYPRKVCHCLLKGKLAQNMKKDLSRQHIRNSTVLPPVGNPKAEVREDRK